MADIMVIRYGYYLAIYGSWRGVFCMFGKIDELGRVVLPREYRRVLGIDGEDEVEILLSANEIVIRKPIFGCVFCGAAHGLARMGDLCVCRLCARRLYEAGEGDVLYVVNVE